MLESRVSAGATQKITWVGETSAKIGCVVPRHGRTCSKIALRDIANWRTKRQSSYTKSQVLVWMIIISRKRNLNQLENGQKICSQIVLKCLHLARVGKPDILWSVNKLARSVTDWTRACDKRLARLISYIHHTNDFRQYCHVGKHGSALSIGSVSRPRFCWSP